MEGEQPEPVEEQGRRLEPVDPAAGLTPGQRAFATVSWQNTADTASVPQTVKIYRSRDGTLANLDALLASTVITGVAAHHGIVIPMSWIATVADSNAPGGTAGDGTASSFLVAIVDEENRTGDGNLANDWSPTTTAAYTVTVPDITINAPASDLIATEGLLNSGKFIFTRSGDTTLPLTIFVDWNTGTLGSTPTVAADFGGKYPGSTGVGIPTAVTFLAGFATTSLNVSPVIDTNTTNESLLEQLRATVIADPSNPTNIAYTVDKNATGFDEVEMDVEDVVNTISIKALDATATEAKATTAKFRLARGTGQSSKLPVTVTVDFGGTALPGATTDYLAKIGATNVTFYGTIGHPAVTLADITIPAKKNFVDIIIKPIDDVLIEGNETVVPTVLVDPDNNQRYIPAASPNNTATANLADNDDIRLASSISGNPQTLTRAGKNQPLRFVTTVTNFLGSASPATSLQVGLLNITAGAVTPAATGKATYDASVIPLTTVNIGAIAANGKKVKAFAIKTSSFNLSGLAPGTYRIVAKADAGNAVIESNENDNYSFTGGIITIV